MFVGIRSGSFDVSCTTVLSGAGNTSWLVVWGGGGGGL